MVMAIIILIIFILILAIPHMAMDIQVMDTEDITEGMLAIFQIILAIEYC